MTPALRPLEKRDDLAEIEIKSHDHAGLSDRLFKDRAVRHSLKPFVPEVCRIVTLRA